MRGRMKDYPSPRCALGSFMLSSETTLNAMISDRT
jgi:hypothetical protein